MTERELTEVKLRRAKDKRDAALAKAHADFDQIVTEAYLQGFSLESLHIITGVSISTLRVRMKRAGTEIRDSGRPTYLQLTQRNAMTDTFMPEVREWRTQQDLDRARWQEETGWEVMPDGPNIMLPKGFAKRRWDYRIPRFLDHIHVIRRTVDGERKYGLLGMPYGFYRSHVPGLDMVDEADAWCAEHGAEWRIGSWSWWNTGTVAVIVTPIKEQA